MHLYAFPGSTNHPFRNFYDINNDGCIDLN